MKHSVILKLTDEQLSEYAQTLGIDISGIESKDEKVKEIESRRDRKAVINILGLRVTVPMKRLHDKRILDKYAGAVQTNTELESFIRDLIGDKQVDAILKACTDDDGTVDADAYLMALRAINSSDELKNF